MATPITRYPFSTLNGQWIPTDILKMTHTIRKDFIAASGSALDILPVDTEIIQITATALCFIRFDAVAVVPIHAAAATAITNTARLLPNIPTLLAVPSLQYSLIGEAAAGTAWVEVVTKWNVLALDVQNQRV